MNASVPAPSALAADLFPEWLRDTVRMASVRAAGPDAVRFRVDPGPVFERQAELVRQPGYGGKVFNLTVLQRYLPYDKDLHFVGSANVHRDSLDMALWQAVNHANLLAPAEYWRSGGGYSTRKPLWAIEADTRQRGAIPVMEALAAARAEETGLPHYLSRHGHRVWCNVNAPHRGEFYSVTREGEWSLHYHPVTYPLDGPPSTLPDRPGTHPVVLAHLRNMAEPSASGSAREPPVVTSPGKARLPRAAWPPEAFAVPFRAKGEHLNTPEPAVPAEHPAIKEALGTWNPAKEIAMKEPEPAAILAIAPDASGDSPPTGDPLEGANAEVQLVPDAARFAKAAGLAQAGFVIETHDADDHLERQCTVHFPGTTGNVKVPDDILVPAPPFPAVTTSHGEIGSIETAEALLIDSAARVRHQLEWGGEPDPAANEDRIRLAKALGNACGMDPHELVRQLDPMIDQQVTAYQAARAAHPSGRKRTGKKKASEIAAADVPRSGEAAEKAGPGASAVIRSEDQEPVAAARPAPARTGRRR